jgi:hypothetical protein
MLMNAERSRGSLCIEHVAGKLLMHRHREESVMQKPKLNARKALKKTPELNTGAARAVPRASKYRVEQACT